MCRIAYQGPAIPLENIVVRPRHSLLTQSQHALETKLAVNGDGFGIAWYADGIAAPGLYRDVLPAWADGNLTSLCRSGLFLAHIRASTVGETSRMNCHPFAYGRWSFCHNGQVPYIARLRCGREAALPDELCQARRGTSDSELLFLTMLAQGLDDDPAAAIAATVALIGPATDGPVRLTCVLSDGARLYGFRHASDGLCPTLYLPDTLDNGGRSFSSEPLDGNRVQWVPLAQDTLTVLDGCVAATDPLGVQRAA